MLTVGVDAHKRVTMAVAIDAAGREVVRWRGPNSVAGWQQLAAWAAARDADVRWVFWLPWPSVARCCGKRVIMPPSGSRGGAPEHWYGHDGHGWTGRRRRTPAAGEGLPDPLVRPCRLEIGHVVP